MRKLLILSFFLPLMALAQSSLPPCPARYMHDCFWTRTYPNGEKYVGEFRNDKPNGQGTYTWPNRGKYVGEFRDGMRHGQGTFTWPNGEKYVGEWRDGQSHGQGVEYRADGSMKLSGRWENNSLVQSYALDTNRFPFNRPAQVAATPTVDPGKAERDRLAAEVATDVATCRNPTGWAFYHRGGLVPKGVEGWRKDEINPGSFRLQRLANGDYDILMI